MGELIGQFILVVFERIEFKFLSSLIQFIVRILNQYVNFGGCRSTLISMPSNDLASYANACQSKDENSCASYASVSGFKVG